MNHTSPCLRTERTYRSRAEAFKDASYACAVITFPRNTIFRRLRRFFWSTPWMMD